MTTEEPSPIAPTENVHWFYKTEQGKAGPVETKDLCDRLSSASLSPETPVWRQGLAAWTPAADCEELQAAAMAGRVVATSHASRKERSLGRTAVAVALLVAIPSWLVMRWFFSDLAVAHVTGTVTAASSPVTGGCLVLSPMSETKANSPGKPGVAMIGPDGRFSVRLEPGSRGLAERFIVRFTPPVLPVMPESEAKEALPPYYGFVPKVGTVAVHAGANVIDIEITPASR